MADEGVGSGCNYLSLGTVNSSSAENGTGNKLKLKMLFIRLLTAYFHELA